MALRLKELREQKGVKQSDLAKYLNVANNTISTWENNQREPDLETLIKIAQYFGVSVDCLIGNDRTIFPPPLTKNESKFLSVFRQLPDKAQSALFVVASQMAPSS